MKILFLDLSTRLESFADLKTRARGGMISSLVRVPDELAKRGHEVFVLSDVKDDGKTAAGTIWCAKDGGCWLKGYDWDFLVLNRGVSEGYSGLNAKHRILWTHDLPHNGFIPEPKIMNVFSGVVVMSDYANRIWRSFYKTIKDTFYIPNGVDKEVFYPREKDLSYMIFGSAPNRGLKRLELIYDAVKTRIKTPVKMKAFSNVKIMHPNEAEFNDYAADYERIDKTGIEMCDPLPQHEYADEIGKAGLMILPTDYPEICSNNILQSLASGTPVITTGNLGSAGEWIKHKQSGMLTDFHVHDYMIHTVEMVRNTVEVLENERLHKKMIKKAQKTNILTWEQVGERWENMFRRLL